MRVFGFRMSCCGCSLEEKVMWVRWGQSSLFRFESVIFVLEISEEFCQWKGGEGSIFTENGFFLMFWALNDLLDLICFFFGFKIIGMRTHRCLFLKIWNILRLLVRDSQGLFCCSFEFWTFFLENGFSGSFFFLMKTIS